MGRKLSDEMRGGEGSRGSLPGEPGRLRIVNVGVPSSRKIMAGVREPSVIYKVLKERGNLSLPSSAIKVQKLK